MISFFRKIRQKLLSQNRVTRYLIYALGEIILVVIGILIALSINNWNENRKSENYELLLLQEIDIAIQSDMALIDGQFIRRTLRKDSAVQALKDLVINEGAANDETIIKLILQTGESFSERYTSGPYEALKSNGLDKIKNDSLRALLVKSYDERLPARMEFIEFFNGVYREAIAEAKRSLIGSRVIDRNGQAVIIEYLKIENTLQNPMLHDLLHHEEMKAAHSLQRLDEMKEILSNMSTHIQEQLKERKGIHYD